MCLPKFSRAGWKTCFSLAVLCALLASLAGASEVLLFEDFDKLLPDFRKATAHAQLAAGSVG